MRSALSEGKLYGVGLDVIEGEREKTYDFRDLNAVVTTHIGWFTREAVRRIVSTALDNIRAFMRGELKNCVNQAILKQRGTDGDTT